MTPTIEQIMAEIGRARAQNAARTIYGYALPYADFTYAQAGEDMLLSRLFKARIAAKIPGLYLDVGCAWPVQGSNTFLFYTLGWRGIGVDANNDHSETWTKQRPLDRFINAAVTDAMADELMLFRSTSNKGAHQIRREKPPGEFLERGEPIKTMRMDEIFALHFKDRSIQLLSIDIEGSEIPALRSNDWARYRPEAIIIECWDLKLEAPISSEPLKFLRDVGYELCSVVHSNALLIDRTGPLATRLAI